MNILLLAGGVGGARMARGFSALPDVATTIVVNIADDARIYGLAISPDIDSVVYALGGVEGSMGWGRENDTWKVMAELERFPLDTSFRLGDQDLAMNLYRTDALQSGQPLSAVTARQSEAFGVDVTILPASDDPVATFVQLDATGTWIDFQTYFVRRGHQDRVRDIRFDGASEAAPAPGVLAAIESADVVVFAPSNPLVSIDPILAIPGIRDAVDTKHVVAVSPFIGGAAVKGPAADLMEAFGLPADASGLARHYGELVDRIVVHDGDRIDVPGIEVLETDTLIPTWQPAARLADEILAWLD